MSFFLLAVAAVSLIGVRFVRFNDECLSRSSTLAVNGVFVLLVMLSHGVGYIETGAFDEVYLAVRAFLGQLVVAPFLFYSGYGIHRQLRSRGESYGKTFFTHRFLRVLFHFDLAVALFLLVQTLLGERFPLRQIALSFIAWEKIGNSNWYIFATLCMYLAVTLSFFLFRQNDLARLLSVTALAVCYVVGLYLFGNRPSDCWYNTVLCFPAGMWFSFFGEKIMPFLKKRLWLSLSLLFVLAGVTVLLEKTRNPWLLNLRAVAFALFLVLLTAHVKIGNRAVCFAGSLTFWIYILQRIPYLVFLKIGLNEINSYLYIFVCLAVTLPLAFAADKLVTLLDNKIWKKKGKAA